VIWPRTLIFPSFPAHFPGQNFTGTSIQISTGANINSHNKRIRAGGCGFGALRPAGYSVELMSQSYC